MCSCVECEVTLYAEIISLMTWFSLCLFFRLASNECVALGARCAHIPNVAWLLYLREVIQYMMRPLNEPSQCVNKFINLTVCSLFFCAHILWIEISITHWNVTRIVSAAFPDKASQEVKMTDKNGTLKWNGLMTWLMSISVLFSTHWNRSHHLISIQNSNPMCSIHNSGVQFLFLSFRYFLSLSLSLSVSVTHFI